MIAEAIDTLFIVCHALLLWIAAGAFVATAALFTLVLSGAWAWRAVRKRHAPDSRPQPVPCGSRDANAPQRASQRRTPPSWARQPHDYEDAA